MRWSAFGTLGRIVHPFRPHPLTGPRPQAAARRVVETTLIQPLHVERAHARAHPLHAAARNRPGTEFIVTVPHSSSRFPPVES